MASTFNAKEEFQKLHDELDALRVLVRALAEVADQSRLKETTEEYKREHIDTLHARDATADEIADFMDAFERLQASY